MRRLVRSDAYLRAKLVMGGLFCVLGIAILARTIGEAGFSGSAIPAYALGTAMLLLGAFRIRDYRRARARR